MLTFSFLRPTSAGGEERAAWSKDKPLTQTDGGSAASITTEKMMKSSESLRAGGSLLGLTTLTFLSTEFSYAGIRFHVQRLEVLARKKFTISPNNVVGGGLANGPMLWAASTATGSGDDFYLDNVPHFPISWPITMPVIVRDATVVPSKWQHGMGDELILSFWKMVDFTKSAMNVMESQGEGMDKAKYALYKAALGQARRLAQNVVIQVFFAETDDQVRDRSLSFREALEDMAEFLGLSGWQRVLIIGQRRDQLKQKGVPFGAQDVTKALAKVEWSSGNCATLNVVQKALNLYDRMLTSVESQDAAFESQNTFGRQSPFEDWSKLLVMLNLAKSSHDSSFVLWTIHYEKLLGKRSEYSQDELRKKLSPISVMCLRKRLIDGLTTMALTSPIDRLSEISLRKPELSVELDALKNLRKAFSTAQSYFQTGRAQDTSECSWLAALPKWAVPLRKLLRAIYDGRHDRNLTGHLQSPPKGGVPAIKFETMAASDDIKEIVNTLKADMENWTADAEGRQLSSATMRMIDGGSGGHLAGGSDPRPACGLGGFGQQHSCRGGSNCP